MVNDLILLESVMDSLTGRQKDPSLLVRVLALRGLGNIAVGAPEKVGANGTELVGSSGAGLGGEGGAYGGHCLLWEWGCWPRPHPGDGAVARPLRPTAVGRWWAWWDEGEISSPKWSGTGNGLPGVGVESPTPGGGREAWRCGTWGRGQWGWVGLGISEVFSNPNDSVMV